MTLATLPWLTGCSGSTDSTSVAPPAAVPARPAKPQTSTEPDQEPGLTTLPSAAQVVASVPAGRTDPFAPLPVRPAAGTAAAPAVDLLFTGVIRSAGIAQALVQIGDQSGPVCVGRRGACPDSGLPPLLPADWSVTSIDVTNGLLVVRQGGQRRVFSL